MGAMTPHGPGARRAEATSVSSDDAPARGAGVTMVGVPPNMPDYERARAEFSWQCGPRRSSPACPAAALNIAYEAVDRHAAGGAGATRSRCGFSASGAAASEFTYAELRAQTDRFANVLRALGVERGDRVFVLAGRIPELYVAALGTLKNGSVFCPLFSAFGPGADRAAAAVGRRAGARDDADALSAQGRRASRPRCPARARASRRRARGDRRDRRGQ